MPEGRPAAARHPGASGRVLEELVDSREVSLVRCDPVDPPVRRIRDRIGRHAEAPRWIWTSVDLDATGRSAQQAAVRAPRLPGRGCWVVGIEEARRKLRLGMTAATAPVPMAAQVQSSRMPP